jgi:Caspase domain
MFSKTSIFVVSFLAAALLAMVGEAFADKRVALIIGNSTYKHAPALPNPANDAAAMSVLLRTAGFDVIEARQNLSVTEIRRVLRDFSDNVRDADIAVVFYAGHGMELDGTNYLIPVDAKLERDVDVEDETVSVDRLVKILEPAKRLRLIILDACRDNPFSKTMKRTLGTRAVGRGLAKVEPASSDTLIAFAAKAGSTASDGSGENSPFTTALLKNIAVPGLDLRIAFGRVRDDVMKNTNNKQEPFVYGSLGGTTVALVPPPAEPAGPSNSSIATPPTLGPSTNPASDIRKDYELAAQIGTKEAWEAFLSIHKIGLYADYARSQIAKLNNEEAKKPKQPTASPPKVPATTAEPSRNAPKVDSPKTSAAPSGRNQIVCGKTGCQEVKPGCTATPLHTVPGMGGDWIVACK